MSLFNRTCLFVALSVPTIAAIGQSASGPAAGLAVAIPTGADSATTAAPNAPAATNPGNLAVSSNSAPGQGGGISTSTRPGGIEKTIVQNPDGTFTETIKYPRGTYPSGTAGGNGQAGQMGITASPGAGNGAATAGSTSAGLVSVSPIVPDDDGDQCKLVHRIAPVLYPVRYFDGYVVSDIQCVYRYPVHCVYVP